MARSRIMLYSFKEFGGKVTLDYTLTSCLVDYDNHHDSELKISLPSGLITLRKAEYLNTGKVYFNGKVFFIVATKWMSKKYALKTLLEFACVRCELRLSTYKKLLAA
jgi:hypothetical protein